MNSTTQKKIPVLDTIRYAYAFTFGHLGTIIGLIWLPMVIFAVAGYFVMSYYYGVVPEAVSGGNPVALGQAGLVVMGWSLVSLMLSAIMYVAVTRQALGLRQGPAVVHFALGAPELRVFAGFIGLFALLLLFLLADAVVLAVIKSLGHSPVMTSVAGAVYLAGLLAIVYAAVRLSFLFIPAGVAEEKIGLAESWQLTRGNFWNIFAVGVAVFLPLVIVVGIAEVAVMGTDFFLPRAMVPGADTAQQMKIMADQMRDASRHLPLLSGLTFLFAPFATGLTLAPSAYAYRALTDARAAASGINYNI